MRRLSIERIGEGPDLVLLHSLLTDRHAFDRLATLLADRCRLHLVDLPGFGASQPAGETVDEFAEVVAATLDVDPTTTTVLGNGLGAFVALGMAIHHGDVFGRLVLVGCGATFPEETKAVFRGMIERVERDGMEAVVDVALPRIFTNEYLAAHPEMGEERRAALLAMNVTSFVAACRALIEVDYSDRLATVRHPTLLLVGSEDRATPPPLGRALADGIPGARLVELPELAHAPHLQDPTTTASLLEGFLAG